MSSKKTTRVVFVVDYSSRQFRVIVQTIHSILLR